MLIRIMILLFVLTTAASCSTVTTVRNMNAANDFQESAKIYNWMIRWHELEKAESTFAADSMRKEYSERVKAAKGVTIADYRIRNQECSPEKKEGTVIVEIDYFIPPSVTLKTVEDVQTWTYVEKEGKRAWRLTSLLPEFK
jgi:hypothetical protein